MATDNDLPPLYRLISEFKDGFLADGEELLSVNELLGVIQAGEIAVLDLHGYPVAAARFSDEMPGLHRSMHLLVFPEFWRQVIKAKGIEAILSFAFDHYQVKKLKALAMETQTNAIKLLKRYGFKQNGLFRNEAKHKGKVVDVFAFELHQKYWKRRIGE